MTRRSRFALVLLALVLLAVHLWIADRVRDEFDLSTQGIHEPKRMSVAYVRELKPTAPVARYAATAPVVAVVGAKAARAVEQRKAAAAAAAAAASEAMAAAEAAAAEAAEAKSVAEAEAADRREAAAKEADAALVGNAASSAEPAQADGASTAASSAAAASDAPAAPAAPAGADADAKPFEWPASTRLSYVLTGNFRGEVHGTAQVEWIRDDAHYQVHLDVVVGAEFAPLFTRKMTSDGQITARGLSPRRYDEDSKLAFQQRRVNAVLFDNDSVTLANGTRAPRPLDVMVQDSASQFVQLTWLFSTRPELLQVGRSIDMPLALPRSLDTWVYDVIAMETLSTPFGALEALHLKPRRLNPTDNARTNALSAEIWIAPTLAYLPARIVIHQNADTYVDLMITRLPQMAAPGK